jgi:hypothetical protein
MDEVATPRNHSVMTFFDSLMLVVAGALVPALVGAAALGAFAAIIVGKRRDDLEAMKVARGRSQLRRDLQRCGSVERSVHTES